ncbi:MAG: T9SS type A sorting domain-containing protein [Bacteroidia bacterium]|nr:T9SS type A sorting domain-containing protein [Bacteroidia bacterium]
MKKSNIFAALFFALALNCTKAQNLQNGLQACYPLDCDANNYAATGGALNGNTVGVTCVSGLVGNAYDFSGSTSSYIQLPNSSLIKPTNAISFSGWVKFDINNAGQYIVFAKNACFNYFEGYALGTSYSGGNMRLAIVKSSNACSPSTQHVLTGGTNLSTGVWYHVGFYAGTDSLKLFLNGVPDATPIVSTIAFSYDNTNVYLGGTNSGIYNAPLDGQMDNVRFYNRKLSNSEFLMLYNNNPSCSATGAPFVLTDSLQACYPLECNANNMAATGSALNGATVGVNCVTGIVGNCYDFLGSSSSYIQLPNDSRIKANTNKISAACWVKFDVNNTGQYILFAQNSCSSYFEGYSLATTMVGSSMRLVAVKSSGACSPSTQHVIVGTTGLSTGTWYHVGFYAGTDSIKMFLNGNPEGTPIVSTTAFNFANTNVYLGGTNSGIYNAPLDGKIDEVRIYNRKLSNSEFMTLKNSFPSCTAAGPGLLNGLQACYPLNCNVWNYAPTTSSVPPPLNGTPYNVQCDTGHVNDLYGSYKFTGSTTSYIELPNDSRIKSNSLSFSCWVKLDALNSLQYIVFAKNTCVSWFEGYALTAVAVSGQIQYQIAKSSSSGVGCGTSGVLSSTGLYSPYIWHHVAFFIDNSNIKLYVDGSAAGSMASSVILNYDNTNVYLGGTNVSYFNYPLNGSIDNVRFYNRELTSTEVAGIAGYDPPCDAIVPCGGNPSNCRPAVVESIQKHSAAGDRIEFYPNPSSGLVHVSNAQNKSFVVYDINGKVVGHTFRMSDETSGEINLSNNAPGIYLIRILDNKGNVVQTSKVIIHN